MKKIGKYEIIEELGKGGMGVVYKALDPDIERFVAIKLIGENILNVSEFYERFKREARAAGKISHENITTVYEAGDEAGRPYIVMEFLQGVELREIIRTRKEVPLSQKVDYAIQICRGLKKAHDNEIIHRDIKPENIQVLDDGRIKIMDFGIARPTTSNLTMTQATIGTPHYMSPEQVKAQKVGKESDIFSFGVVLYELLTYKRPFNGDRIESIMYKIVHEEPEQVEVDKTVVGSRLHQILAKCLAKAPEQRYRDFSALIKDLTALKVGQPQQPIQLLDQDQVATMPAASQTQTPNSTGRSRVYLFAGLALFIAISVGIFWTRGLNGNRDGAAQGLASGTPDISAQSNFETTSNDSLGPGGAYVGPAPFQAEANEAMDDAVAARETAMAKGASGKLGFQEGLELMAAAAQLVKEKEFAAAQASYQAAEARFEDAMREAAKSNLSTDKPELANKIHAGDATVERSKTSEKRQEIETANAVAFASNLYQSAVTQEARAEKLYNEKKYDLAIMAYKEAAGLYDQTEQAKTTWESANRHFQNGEYDQSIAVLNKFTASSAKLSALQEQVTHAKLDRDRYLNDARRQLNSGNLRDAMALLNTLNLRDKNSAEVKLLKDKIVASDSESPIIAHEAPKSYPAAEALKIEASVRDNLMTEQVMLFYRRKNVKAYAPIPMSPAENDKFTAIIPPEAHRGREIHYFFVATDSNGNKGRLRGPKKAFRVKGQRKDMPQSVIIP